MAGNRSSRRGQVYRRIASELRDQILRGELKAGERLPSLRELADRYEVAPMTVSTAINVLTEERLVVTRHGAGTFVESPAEVRRWITDRYASGQPVSPNIREARTYASVNEMMHAEHRYEEATATLAERLRIPEGAPLSTVTYLLGYSGIPVQWAQQWEPMDLVGGTEVEVPPTYDPGPDVIARFAMLGWEVTHVAEDIRARMPWDEERALLQIDGSAVPVLAMTRYHLARNREGEERIVETANIILRGDRHVLQADHRVASGDVPVARAAERPVKDDRDREEPPAPGWAAEDTG